MKRADKLAIVESMLDSARSSVPSNVDEDEFFDFINYLQSAMVGGIGYDPPTPEEIAENQREEDEYDRIRDAWDKWEKENGRLNHAIPSIPHTPDEIAFEGACILFDSDDGTWGTGHTYVCTNLENPTWGKIMRAFDIAIAVTGDTHHCFLEGLVKVLPREYDHLLNMEAVNDGVTVLRFATGS